MECEVAPCGYFNFSASILVCQVRLLVRMVARRKVCAVILLMVSVDKFAFFLCINVPGLFAVLLWSIKLGLAQ